MTSKLFSIVALWVCLLASIHAFDLKFVIMQGPTSTCNENLDDVNAVIALAHELLDEPLNYPIIKAGAATGIIDAAALEPALTASTTDTDLCPIEWCEYNPSICWALGCTLNRRRLQADKFKFKNDLDSLGELAVLVNEAIITTLVPINPGCDLSTVDIRFMISQ